MNAPIASPLICALVLSLVACGDDRPPAADAGTDAADTSVADADAGDASSDADAMLPRCPESLVSGVTFDIDPDGADGQIHAAAVWDGERTVIAFNRPDPANNFDVFVTTLSCDGTPGVSERINTTDYNDVDPDIAYDGRTFFIAWTSDDGTGGSDNLHVFARGLDGDLRPMGDADVEVRTARQGSDVPGNHMGASVFVADTGFVVAGVRGLADIDRFHAFAQSVDASGALLGEAYEPAYEPMITHRNVAGAATPSGLVLAYERIPDDAPGQVMTARTEVADTWELAVEGLVETGGPSLASRGDTVFAVLSGDIIPMATDIRLTDLGRSLAERPVEILGASRRLDVAPRVVLGPMGGAVAYFRLSTGSYGKLIVQRFTYEAGSFSVGPEVEVVSSAAAPYGPALTHVIEDIYFLAWTEGTSPALRLRGRYVDLATP